MWRERPFPQPTAFIEPCLPRAAKQPPAGRGWIHEIKHDGFRIMARRADGRVQLLTRKGTNFASRFPQIIEAMTGLPVRSCLIDGEAIVCNGDGLAVFDLLRSYQHDGAAVLCAFDLLELDGEDLRRTPIGGAGGQARGRGGLGRQAQWRANSVRCQCPTHTR
jgi:bifunctional non-homologous end joining protein LigD